MNSKDERQSATDFAERVRTNQQKLRSGLKCITTSSSVGQAPLARWWRAAWPRPEPERLASLTDQINNSPMLFALLQVI